MTQNSNRSAILRKLHIPSDETWAGDIYWDSEKNDYLLEWISHDFILNTRVQWKRLAICRTQLHRIWEYFRVYLARTSRPLDIRNIDLRLLVEFEKTLPSLRWSCSAIGLIELLLICVRRQLHRQKIIYACSPAVKQTLRRTPLEPTFPVSVKDLRTIQKRFFDRANDYEITFFDLITTHSQFRLCFSRIKGSDVHFDNDRAYIMADYMPHPLPLEVSQRLLKLMRSRDILSDEDLFGGVGNLWKAFCKKVAAICTAHNIPTFAREAIWGFLSTYLLNLLRQGLYESDQIRSILFPNTDDPPAESSLKILDRVYHQITRGRKFFEFNTPYSPHPILVELVPPQRLSLNDTTDAKITTK
jgi:hypothetical protein